MQLYSLEKKIFLPKSLATAEINIKIPLSDSAVIREDDDFIDNILVNQYCNGLESAVFDFENSELPSIFINGQRFLITNNLPVGFYGLFCLTEDDLIVADADTISNIRKLRASYLLAHEMGHKIAKYRDTREAYKELAQIFGISLKEHEDIIAEIYADICGNIVTDSNDYHLIDRPVSKADNEHAKQLVLKSVYKC